MCRGNDTVVPELGRRRAIGVAALERKALCREHVVARFTQELGLVLGRDGAIRRDQHDPPRAQRTEGTLDGGNRGGRARRASPCERREDLLLAGPAALHRVGRAVECHHVAAGIGECAGRVLDAGQKLIEGETIGAGHAQPRDMPRDASWKGRNRLLLDHPVR